MFVVSAGKIIFTAEECATDTPGHVVVIRRTGWVDEVFAGCGHGGSGLLNDFVEVAGIKVDELVGIWLSYILQMKKQHG